MKYFALLAILGIGIVPFASAAQLEAEILYDDNQFEPEFSFLRVLTIEYPQGSILAELLQEEMQQVSFDADLGNLGVKDIVLQVNEHLKSVGSDVTVTDMRIQYHASLQGNERYANIEYKIQLIPIIAGHVIEDFAQKRTVDASWRGLSLTEPLIVHTEYGLFDINSSMSAIDVMAPEVSKNLDSVEILDIPLIDASRILEFPLHKWHSLFDNTAIIASAAEYKFAGKNVMTNYSMGECNLETGICNDKKWEETISSLDVPYQIRIVESRDDASIVLEGYAQSTHVDGIEVLQASLDSPLSQRPDTDEFPATVMYGMAGLAAVGGVAVFVISNQKLKRDKGEGQTGIDPSHLRSYETSISAGGYKTNRGESYLIVDDASRTAI